MSTRAISWAAVSSRPQAQRESLHEQYRLNHALAEALSWDVGEEITVPGQSRSYYRLSDTHANIEAYPRLMQPVQAGTLDWVICKDRTGLGRTRRLNREVADCLQDHGVRGCSRALPPASIEERTEGDVWGEPIIGLV
jgi:hypothetical protein